MSSLFLEGLIYGGKFTFQIDWASLIGGKKFTVSVLFFFEFEGISKYNRAYIWRGDLTEVFFLRYVFGGLIFGGAYKVFSLTWPASMLIHWSKRKFLHKKRVQLPQVLFGTPTWPPF